MKQGMTIMKQLIFTAVALLVVALSASTTSAMLWGNYPGYSAGGYPAYDGHNYYGPSGWGYYYNYFGTPGYSSSPYLYSGYYSPVAHSYGRYGGYGSGAYGGYGYGGYGYDGYGYGGYGYSPDYYRGWGVPYYYAYWPYSYRVYGRYYP